MIRTRFGYTLLLFALLPRVLLHLLWRARRQPAYLKHIPERFGYYRQGSAQPLIWIHAVSVGETRAAEPLVRALQKEYPAQRILLTHMTPTGREAGETLFGDSVLRCYLPYDYPRAVARFLDHFRPQAGLLMETELWSNLIHACRERGVPLHLINARLSEKSFARYRRFRELARTSLRELAGIAAQTEGDAQRLERLGAENVVVTGNLKFDIRPPLAQLEMGEAWRRDYGAGRPVLLAASTREGEEEVLLERFSDLGLPSVLLVIVPRHPQRFEEVAALVARHKLRCQRRSEGAPVDPQTRVLLGDSMGEMFAYYAACDVAFIGGSLLPFGGQNLIEACAVGRPVLLGPHTYNFSEAAESAVEAGAALRVGDAGELMRVARRLLADADAAARMGQAGLAFSRRHRGATQRVIKGVRPHFLPRRQENGV
jgi:3-deoxy-D-manno-octulosonic-acid transferase